MNRLICVHHEYLSIAVYLMADAIAVTINPVELLSGGRVANEDCEGCPFRTSLSLRNGGLFPAVISVVA